MDMTSAFLQGMLHKGTAQEEGRKVLIHLYKVALGKN